MALRTKRSLSFDLSKNLYIEETDLENYRFIGQGSFGHVWKCSLRSYTKPVALKRVSLPIEEEGMILQSLSHPNIIKYLGVIHNPPAYGLVMEFAENGSLGDYLHRDNCDVTRSEKESFIKQISAGMLYLHHGANFPIIHRDLKPQNILLSNNHTLAKIADFGCAKLIVDGTVTGSNRGSVAYMAPELIREEGKLSRAADVYSFGVVIWEILTRKRPFSGKNEAQIIYFKGRGNCLPIDDQNITEPYKEVIERCFQQERRNRPDFKFLHAAVTHSLNSNSTNSSVFSFGSERMAEISASGDNSHMAWICYSKSLVTPPQIAPSQANDVTDDHPMMAVAQWSPQERKLIAVRKNAKTLMVLNEDFFSVEPPAPGIDEQSSGRSVPDLGPELAHRHVVTCFSWASGGGGGLLAVGTEDGRVWLWTGSGTLLRRVIIRNKQPVLKLEWNADSSLIGVLCGQSQHHQQLNSTDNRNSYTTSSSTGVDVFVVSLETTEFNVSHILSFDSFSDVLSWSKVKQDMLVCCERHKVHIFKNDDFSLSSPKSSHQSHFTAAVWSPFHNSFALVSKTELQIFSVENSDENPSRMKVRSKTAMSKLGEIKGVTWHPKNPDEILVNNFAEILVINVAKKTHRRIYEASDDSSALAFFSISPSGQAVAIFDEDTHSVHVIRTDASSPVTVRNQRDNKNVIGKITLMKKDSFLSTPDTLTSNPIWNADGSRLCLDVEFGMNKANMFDHALLLVNLEGQYNVHCLVLERP